MAGSNGVTGLTVLASYGTEGCTNKAEALFYDLRGSLMCSVAIECGASINTKELLGRVHDTEGEVKKGTVIYDEDGKKLAVCRTVYDDGRGRDFSCIEQIFMKFCKIDEEKGAYIIEPDSVSCIKGTSNFVEYDNPRYLPHTGLALCNDFWACGLYGDLARRRKENFTDNSAAADLNDVTPGQY